MTYLEKKNVNFITVTLNQRQVKRTHRRMNYDAMPSNDTQMMLDIDQLGIQMNETMNINEN